MDFIKDIVQPLQQRLGAGALATFYDRRQAFKGGTVRRPVLLSEIKNDEVPRRGYAFHRGGRSELQFNIGFEGEGEWFRFGVAYSIQTGPYFADPVGVLDPSIQRFNAVLREADIANLRMWRYEDGHPRPPGPVHPIPSSWVRKGVFVFIGRRVRLGDAGVTHAILDEAASTLERLWPLYEAVEGRGAIEGPITERRIARLCWNTHRWAAPSGRANKSRLKKSFEGKHGYGHEEWLFDWAHVIDGWQYGFIQGIKPAHRGEVFNLLLYTLQTPKSARYWVGTIHGLEVLDADMARVATRELEKTGALKQMRDEISALGLVPGTLSGAAGIDVLNVRFRPAHAELFDVPVPFPKAELPMGRYVIQAPKRLQNAIYQPGPARDEVFKRSLHTAVIRRTTFASQTDIDPVHAKWQAMLEVSVPRDLPGATADAERPVDGHAVDLIIDHDGLRVFVELKTDPSPRRVIRAALAQLMEYAYRPEERRCDALVIAGALPAGADDELFLAMLRERFGIPVHFLQVADGCLVGLADFWAGLKETVVPRT